MKSLIFIFVLLLPTAMFSGANLDLFDAVESGDLEGVKTALNGKANINAICGKYGFVGYTPLMFAAYKGHAEIARFLIESNAEINARNPNGATALMIASAGTEFGSEQIPNYDEIVRLLLKAKASVHYKTKKDYAGEHTALMSAALFGREEAVKMLIEAGSKLNEKATDGATALIIAARGTSDEVVRCLLAAKAKINLKDKSGMTAIMWAKKNGRTEIIELLRNAGARE